MKTARSGVKRICQFCHIRIGSLMRPKNVNSVGADLGVGPRIGALRGPGQTQVYPGLAHYEAQGRHTGLPLRCWRFWHIKARIAAASRPQQIETTKQIDCSALLPR